MSMKSWLLNVIVGAVSVLSAAGSVAYNQLLAPQLNDKTVYLAARTVLPNTMISNSDLRAALVPTANVSPTAVLDPSKIIGKMAAQIVSQNTQITTSDLEDNPLVPSGDDIIVGINQSWISSVPNTLRRGDLVSVYVAPSHQSGPTASSLAPLPTNPILTNVPIEFVQNGSNQEVINSSSGTNTSSITPNWGDSRANGSSAPAFLELLISSNDWTTSLYPYIIAGDQLIFVATYSNKTTP